MPQYRAPLDDFRFLYNEFLDLESLSDLPTMAEVSPDLIESILDEAAKITQEVLQPLNEVGDRVGCRHDDADHSVTMPEGFREAYQQFCEAGWPGLVADPEYGGQGLPTFVGLAVSEMKNAANPSFAAYPGLTLGAYEVIHAYGSEEQKETYLPKMISGEWTGTMNLTEPQCGTDLGLIRTRAEANEDGSFAITGTKIWITAGEHDMADNIIHLVLARLPDAPAGTRGISLFLVPKFLVNEDGSIGDRNGVVCSSIEKKMGIKASATCEMTYSGARGFLVGEPNRGLAAMFTMMNAARLVTGIQGLGMAEAAYQAAVTFARERLQGRSLDGAKSPDKPADSILVHPDVRRMLMISRAHIEGARALGLYTGVQLETEQHHPDESTRQKASYWVELMTPIIKAHFTDIGFDVANLGMQVHGGAGYVTDTGVEQFARDVRITQIYEGTNGIQALDLVGRKLVANNGENLKAFFEPVQAFLAEQSGNEAVADFIGPLAEAAQALQETTGWVYQQMASNPIEAGAASSDYLKLFALTATAFMWARMAVIAQAKVGAGETRGGFYQAKLDTGRFFMTRMLPERLGLEAKIKAGAAPMMALHDEAF
jgi:alkylation response protein AidB-like acyl-CoA dehydrogenase